jgi:hypothetical protein
LPRSAAPTGLALRARFFEECRDEQNRRALEGRRLLAAEFRDIEDEVEAMVDDGES